MRTNRILALLIGGFLLLPHLAWGAYIGSPPLLVVNGGTGATTFTPHGPLVGEGTSPIAALTPLAGGVLYQSSSSADPVISRTPILGFAGAATGTLGLSGSTGGTVTIQPQASFTSYNFNLPTGAGSSGQLLASAAGGSSAMTFDNIVSHLTAGTGITITGTTNATITSSGGAGITPTVATVTGSSPFTLSSTDLVTTISSMATPAAATYNLPTPVSSGFRSCLKDGTTNFNSNNATVKTTDGTTIDGVAGATGYVITQQHAEACFISDGVNWFLE